MGMCSIITVFVWTWRTRWAASYIGFQFAATPKFPFSYYLPVHSSSFVCVWVVVSAFSPNNQILPLSLSLTYLISKLTMISCVSPVHVEVRKVLRYSLAVKQQGYRVWAQSNINKLTSSFQQTISSCVRVPTITDSRQAVLMCC